MESSYYDKDKHKYMHYENDLFADFVYSIISNDSFSKYDTAIEFGAGMGRFSGPITVNFSNVTIVEPVRAYADTLKKTFSKNNVRIINTTAEEFLSVHTIDNPVIVFCFHLMHHIKYEQRQAIYKFVKQTDSKCILVEPNSYNPFLLLQILLDPDMSFMEEIQYLTLTYRKYSKEFKKNGLVLTSFKRFCFFPPFITFFFLRKFPRRAVMGLEEFNRFLPVMSSYQLITCE